MSQYMIRIGKRGEYSWLRYLYTGTYGWCGRKEAKRFVGKEEARRAADELEEAIADWYACEGRQCPELRLAIVPATGGMAINRR